MIHALFDEKMQQFAQQHPHHPFLKELATALTVARFELTAETMEDIELIAGKLMLISGGSIQCIVDPNEQPDQLSGNA